jgi:hypothetical protein
MSARVLVKPAGWASPPRRNLPHSIWDKSETEAYTFVARPPVQVRLGTGFAELLVDTKDETGVEIRDDRESIIRCGTALFHLKLALKREGSVKQLELFPDLDRLSLVARIGCGSSCNCKAEQSAIIEGFSQSQREVAPITEAHISNRILASLSAVGASGKAWLDFSRSELSRKQLCEIETSKERLLRAGSHHDEGLVAQVVPTGPKPIGVIRSTLEYLRLSQVAALFLGQPNQTLGSGTSTAPNGVKAPDQMEALAIVKTKTDDKYGWLAAGEVIARVRLEAAKLNVPSEVFGQAFLERQARQELRTAIGRKGFVQAIMGFGSR